MTAVATAPVAAAAAVAAVAADAAARRHRSGWNRHMDSGHRSEGGSHRRHCRQGRHRSFGPGVRRSIGTPGAAVVASELPSALAAGRESGATRGSRRRRRGEEAREDEAAVTAGRGHSRPDEAAVAAGRPAAALSQSVLGKGTAVPVKRGLQITLPPKTSGAGWIIGQP